MDTGGLGSRQHSASCWYHEYLVGLTRLRVASSRVPRACVSRAHFSGHQLSHSSSAVAIVLQPVLIVIWEIPCHADHLPTPRTEFFLSRVCAVVRARRAARGAMAASPLPAAPLVASSLYVGTTMHARARPAANVFRYSLFMACVDVDALEAGALDAPLLFSAARTALTALRPSERLGGAPGTLGERVRALVRRRAGVAADGQVLLLAGIKVFGMEFNPVSFYYVLKKGGGGEVEALVAEVHNIPWFEEHLYVLTPDPGGGGASAGCQEMVRFGSHAKEFHVSPFMPLAGITYDWLASAPGERLGVRIGLSDAHGPFFSARLDLARRPFGAAALAWLLVTYPLMTVKVVVGIMYEAARLWRAGFTFYPHPSGAETFASRVIAQCVAGFATVSTFLRRARGGGGTDAADTGKAA